MHLSDGGHFENTAVYELIRRHCRVIIASDCGADGESAFDDLGNMVRRVREDFGVDVRIDTRPLRPGPDGLSRQHMVAGDIHYPDGDTGVLLLFKPVLTGTEPADVLQYRARNGAFPHESTGDQFYDEAQWESYRRLGEYGVTTSLRVVTDGLHLLRSGRSDEALRPVWGDAFARARREWFPEPEGYGERLSRFSDRVAELDGLLREGGCRLLMEQVYKELPEMERQNRVLLNAPVMAVESDADGVERAVPVSGAAPPADAAPSGEELSSSLYLIRRALLLMEELFHGEDLARNYSHPRYLGVMNWCARWAYAPLFRLWWPLLKTMYPQPFTRFMEQHFSLTGVEHPVGAGERLEGAVRPGGDGFAEECWRRQGMPPATAGETVFSYHLRMTYAGQRGYELQAARLGASLHDGTLVWDADRFYVPPGLWGVGIGTDFLRALRNGAAPGVRYLVARVAFDPAAGSAGRKRAADEIHLYRAAGFREVDLVGGSLLVDGAAVPLAEACARRGTPETQWLFSVAGAAVGTPRADRKLPLG